MTNMLLIMSLQQCWEFWEVNKSSCMKVIERCNLTVAYISYLKQIMNS